MKSYRELMEAKDEEDEFKAAVDRIKNNKSSDMLKMLEKSFLKKSYKYKEKDLKKLLKMISDKMKKLGEELMEAKDKGFKVGDKVKIKTSGLTRMTERGFKKFLGKSGKIVKDYGDGDMKVNVENGWALISIDSKDLVKS